MNGEKKRVSIVKYDETSNAVKKAIELCDGFENLKKNDKVLLKPNIVWGSRSKHLQKFGVLTTTRIIEDIVQLLRDRGCENISIGEGTVPNKEMGSDTFQGFKWTGISRVAKKYGLKLIDFNKESFQKFELDGSKIKIASPAVDADFLINIPVLKTHAQTKVSLGMKNLKGCLNINSKMEFHRKDLEYMIALLNTHIKPSLTVIDGIYALERGPGFGGTAHRTNLLIASQDPFSCDLVGTAILGIDPVSVSHLIEFAKLEKRSLELEQIDIEGEKIKNVRKKLEWDIGNLEEFFQQMDVKGVTFQSPGKHLCSGCSVPIEVSLGLFVKDNTGSTFDNVEICCGPDVRAKKESKKVFLVGDCSIRANKDLEDSVRVTGCPPKVGDTFVALTKHALDKEKAKKIMMRRLFKKVGYKLGIYDENLTPHKRYDPQEFSRSHF